MVYLNFARKYRPQNFDEIVGQDHICITLKNAIKNNRIGHAFLFTGSRGIGKTSTARILAKTLNCKSPREYNPCNECTNCIEITEGRSLDVFEIDGASNRGIDQVRDLRESVRYPPTNSKYKIYIIDEVHMLTKEAFNALLKTIEEPPPHVVFIFATTEPTKIPATILSRCLRFDFHRIPVQLMVEQLKKIVKEEMLNIDDDILLLIAKKADGSLRDAESLLDQVVSFSNKSPSIVEVQKILGIIDSSYFFKASKAILDNNLSQLVKIVDEVYQMGLNVNEFLNGLADHFRTLLAVNLSGINEAMDLPQNLKEQYLEESKFWEAADLIRIMKILSESIAQIKSMENQKTYLELTLLKLGLMDKTVSITELLKTISGAKIPSSLIKTEEKTLDIFEPGNKAEPKKSVSKKRITENVITTNSEKDEKIFKDGITIKEIVEKWHIVIERIHEKNPSIANFLEHGKPVKFENGILEIHFSKDSEFHFKNIKQRRESVEKIISQVLSKEVRLKPIMSKDTTSTVPDGAKKSITNIVMDVFDGEIIEKREVKGG